MTGLRQLTIDLDLVASDDAAGGAQLRGSCQRLTSLELTHAGVVLDGDLGGREAAWRVKEMLTWVQSLGSLRRLTLPLMRPNQGFESRLLQVRDSAQRGEK